MADEVVTIQLTPDTSISLEKFGERGQICFAGSRDSIVNNFSKDLYGRLPLWMKGEPTASTMVALCERSARHIDRARGILWIPDHFRHEGESCELEGRGGAAVFDPKIDLFGSHSVLFEDAGVLAYYPAVVLRQLLSETCMLFESFNDRLMLILQTPSPYARVTDEFRSLLVDVLSLIGELLSDPATSDPAIERVSFGEFEGYMPEELRDVDDFDLAAVTWLKDVLLRRAKI